MQAACALSDYLQPPALRLDVAVMADRRTATLLKQLGLTVSTDSQGTYIATFDVFFIFLFFCIAGGGHAAQTVWASMCPLTVKAHGFSLLRYLFIF